MSQHPKPEVRRAIVEGAVAVFSEAGFEGATVGAIARRAETSVGNVYKYFANKDELFSAAIPEQFTAELTRRIREQVAALRGEADALGLAPNHPYRRASEDLLDFAFEHRARIVFLLSHAEGTVHAAFSETLVRELVRLATRHAETTYPNSTVSAAKRRSLKRIYRSFLATLAAILEEEPDQIALREATQLFAAYHLTGLRALLSAPGRHHSHGVPHSHRRKNS